MKTITSTELTKGSLLVGSNLKLYLCVQMTTNNDSMISIQLFNRSISDLKISKTDYFIECARITK